LVFGSPSSVRGTEAPFAYASANCLSNAPDVPPALRFSGELDETEAAGGGAGHGSEPPFRVALKSLSYA
jgi:hypothetical protein